VENSIPFLYHIKEVLPRTLELVGCQNHSANRLSDLGRDGCELCVCENRFETDLSSDSSPVPIPVLVVLRNGVGIRVNDFFDTLVSVRTYAELECRRFVVHAEFDRKPEVVR